jgi:hypothetical protein
MWIILRSFNDITHNLF